MSHSIPEKIAFLGAGTISEIWIDRLVSGGMLLPGNILATDIRAKRRNILSSRFGIRTTLNNAEAPAFADWLVLAVPPPDALPVVGEIRPVLTERHRLVSLAAALGLAKLQNTAGPAEVLRVMPNAPSLVGEAMNLVALNAARSDVDRRSLSNLLEVFGKWKEVPDELMNAWCALCAVGPTYLLPALDALAAAATARGVSRDDALAAVAQLAIGTGRLLANTGRAPDDLKQLISLRTLPEAEARAVFTAAYEQAFAKLTGVTQKIGAAA